MKKVLLLLVLVLSVHSTVYHVTHDAAGGGDGSSGSPWTIAEAFASATTGGDTVLIKATGDYVPSATIVSNTAKGTSSAPVYFIGANSSGVIDGTQALILGTSTTGSDVEALQPATDSVRVFRPYLR